MAHLFANAQRAFQSAQQLAHRNDFAYVHPAEVRPATGALRVSNAQDLGVHTLVKIDRALQASRSFDDEIRRLTQSGVYPNTTSNALFPNAREYRNTKFDVISTIADNTQGECHWAVFPTLTPSDLDDSLKSFFNLSGVGIAVDNATLFDWRKRQLILKNASTQKVEVDIWLLWPKDDVPFSEILGYDESYFYGSGGSFYTTDAPNVFKYPYNTLLMPTAGGSTDPNSTAEFKTSEARRYNDWSANPYENPWLRQFFDVEYKMNSKLMPGDEITYEWGTPTSQRVHPFTQLLLNAGEFKDAYPFYNRYALMKRCGPIVLLRQRGRLVHIESKAGTASAVNFGLHFTEFALITTQKWRPLGIPFDYFDEFHAVVPSGGDPQDINQSNAADSWATHFTAPVEQAFTI